MSSRFPGVFRKKKKWTRVTRYHVTGVLLRLSMNSHECVSTRMSQMFYILETYFRYSSIYNKSRCAFKEIFIVLQCLRWLFYQFFDLTLIPILDLWDEELLHWSFHHLLVAEASRGQEGEHESERYIPSETTFLGVLWFRADTLSYPAKQRIPSLKLPPAETSQAQKVNHESEQIIFPGS